MPSVMGKPTPAELRHQVGPVSFDQQHWPKSLQELEDAAYARNREDESVVVPPSPVSPRGRAPAKPIPDRANCTLIGIGEVHRWMQGQCVLPVLTSRVGNLNSAFAIEESRDIPLLPFTQVFDGNGRCLDPRMLPMLSRAMSSEFPWSLELGSAQEAPIRRM